MQIEQQKEQICPQTQMLEEADAYSLFIYAVRSQATRDYYLRRLKIFFNYISLFPEGTMEQRCNLFAANGLKDPNWAFSYIVKFLQFQKERVEKEMEFRKECGEHIDSNSWVMRQLWNTKEGHYHHGTIKDAAKLKSSGIKRLIEDALWTQGVRKKANRKRNRYEFQTDHGFRKWFKTRCEIAGMKSINIEELLSHSTGITDSYYRVTQSELLEDYQKAIDALTISDENRMRNKINELNKKVSNNDNIIKFGLREKDAEIQMIKQDDEINRDAIVYTALKGSETLSKVLEQGLEEEYLSEKEFIIKLFMGIKDNIRKEDQKWKGDIKSDFFIHP